MKTALILLVVLALVGLWALFAGYPARWLYLNDERRACTRTGRVQELREGEWVDA